jgi:ferredoxin-NADP reductase
MSFASRPATDAGETEARRVLLLAGGVGLAPFVSILRDAAARAGSRPFGSTWAQSACSRTPPAGWAGATGHLGAAALDLRLAGTAAVDTPCYLSGPPAMVTAAESALSGFGVPPGRAITTVAPGPRSADVPCTQRRANARGVAFALR